MEDPKLEEAWYICHQNEIRNGEYGGECPHYQQQSVSNNWEKAKQLMESQQNQSCLRIYPTISSLSMEGIPNENEVTKIQYALLVGLCLGMMFKNSQEDV